ncbi:3-deoxy-7-phosphoheptulonate synthase [Streptomyces sp. NPDC006235]|uniref:3-deoxy-7-phosphoheptulonate synthase n=1 Tax=Streptomyces sp. NPDC006235 TaxID=3156736 RepID=UPI0033B1DE65
MCSDAGGGRYGSSGHFLWIGDRTRQPDHQHVQFAASVSNPVGVKIGPKASPEEIRTCGCSVTRADPAGCP